MRKLSGKTINSLALCVALAAPLVYMFGTLFMYLAGAHGNMELAGMEQNERILNRDNFTDGITPNDQTGVLQNDTRFASTNIYEIQPSTTYNYTFENLVTGTTSQFRIYYYDTNQSYINYGVITPAQSSFSHTSPNNAKYVIWAIYNIQATSTSNPYISFDSIKVMGKTKALMEKSDYLFGQFFAQNNWLAESGREVLEATPQYGFEPIGELVRYTDANMLHLANLSYGPLVIGYTYYCAHVIIVDLIFYIGSFIPRLIKKTINKLEGGLD